LNQVSPIKALVTLCVATFIYAVLAAPSAGSASAHGVQKYRDGRVVGQVRRKHPSRRDTRSYRRRRDPAIFASQVDLSRPGGPERFFELLREENR